MTSKTCAPNLRFQLWASLALGAVACLGQNVSLNPSCGKVGTKVCLTGSGWAEPLPVCHYTFSFDGAMIAPNQPDGLYGPPMTSFLVPAAADGDHPVLVQLLLDQNNTLLQQKSVNFKVQSNIPDPLVSTTAGAPATNDIFYNFNPMNVCDVSPCTKLVFIQVDRRVGIKNDGTEVSQPDSAWGFDAVGDKDLVGDNYIVDRIIGAKVPYYHDGNGFGYNTQCVLFGLFCFPSNKAAASHDAPSQSDGSFPVGFKAVRLEFETAVFCAGGDDAGKYFGRILWKWEKTKGGGLGTSTVTGTDRNQPSANFTSALNKWISNPDHPFTLPMSNTPSCP